jgi:hypothetical protein
MVIPRTCGVSSTPRPVVSITAVSGILDRLPARTNDNWLYVCVAAARFTQGHANRFPQKRKRAQGLAGRQMSAPVLQPSPVNEWLIEKPGSGSKKLCLRGALITDTSPDLAARSFVNQSYRACGADRNPREGVWAFRDCGPATNLHSRCCRAIASSVTIATRLLGRDWARHGCASSWRIGLTKTGCKEQRNHEEATSRGTILGRENYAIVSLDTR